jgi:hypothetical protein
MLFSKAHLGTATAPFALRPFPSGGTPLAGSKVVPASCGLIGQRRLETN